MIYIFFLVFLYTGVTSSDIGNKISNYFNSDEVLSLKRQWVKQKQSFDNAIATALQENFGYKLMNVYIRRMTGYNLLTKGLHISDNAVDVLLMNVKLREIPRIQMPEVSLSAPSNFIHITAGIAKIFVDTDYALSRNTSSLLSQGEEQDPYKHSPFTFQQVKGAGQVTIIAEGCTLAALSVITLDGNTLNMGHTTVKISDCKFNIEIFTAGTGVPPVMVPYFNAEQGELIQRLISTPLKAELTPKIQGMLFNYINTTTVFGDQLNRYQKKQRSIIKETSDYITEFVSKLNKKTIKENNGWSPMETAEVHISTLFHNNPINMSYTISGVTVHGLDTAYAACSGGPLKTSTTIKISEEIRFANLQVRGKWHYGNETNMMEQDFSVEISDVVIDVSIDVNRNDEFSFDFIGWRTLEISISKLELTEWGRILSDSYITGYVINNLPKYLMNHLSIVTGYGTKKKTLNGQKDDSNNRQINDEHKSDEVNDNDKTRSLEVNDKENTRSLEVTDKKNTRSIEVANKENTRSLEVTDKENFKSLEVKNNNKKKLLKKIYSDKTRSLELTDNENTRSVEVTDKENSRSLEVADKENIRSLEVTGKENTRSLEVSDKENSRSLEANDKENTRSLEVTDKENARSLEATDKENARSLEVTDKENTRSLEFTDKENIRSLEFTDKENTRSLEVADKENTKSLEVVNIKKNKLEKKIEGNKTRSLEVSDSGNAKSLEQQNSSSSKNTQRKSYITSHRNEKKIPQSENKKQSLHHKRHILTRRNGRDLDHNKPLLNNEI